MNRNKGHLKYRDYLYYFLLYKRYGKLPRGVGKADSRWQWRPTFEKIAMDRWD